MHVLFYRVEFVATFLLIYLVQSLIDWDYKEPSSLLRVIEELLQEYRKHQERLISESQRLQFEYNSLIQETDIESGAVEIHVSRSEVLLNLKNSDIGKKWL